MQTGTAHLVSFTKTYISLTFFKKGRQQDKKCIAKAMMDNPSSKVHIGTPERTRMYENSTLESYVSSEL